MKKENMGNLSHSLFLILGIFSSKMIEIASDAIENGMLLYFISNNIQIGNILRLFMVYFHTFTLCAIIFILTLPITKLTYFKHNKEDSFVKIIKTIFNFSEYFKAERKDDIKFSDNTTRVDTCILFITLVSFISMLFYLIGGTATLLNNLFDTWAFYLVFIPLVVAILIPLFKKDKSE